MPTQIDHDFLNQIEIEKVINMFDLLPGVLFWIKDINHVFLHANQAFIEHKKVKGLGQIIGKTDHDFSPTHIAKQFIRDDEKILSGQSVTERLEVNMTQTGDTAWYATSKRSLSNKAGEIIGSYGITRNLQKQAMALTGVEAINVQVHYVSVNYQKTFLIDELK